MKPNPPKLIPTSVSQAPLGKTVSVTFQGDGYTIVIRQGKKVQRWQGDRHRERLWMFCLERGFRLSKNHPQGMVIFRNWI